MLLFIYCIIIPFHIFFVLMFIFSCVIHLTIFLYIDYSAVGRLETNSFGILFTCRMPYRTVELFTVSRSSTNKMASNGKIKTNCKDRSDSYD